MFRVNRLKNSIVSVKIVQFIPGFCPLWQAKGGTFCVRKRCAGVANYVYKFGILAPSAAIFCLFWATAGISIQLSISEHFVEK
jgi:hypothetical protein